MFKNTKVGLPKGRLVTWLICIPVVADVVRGVIRETIDHGVVVLDMNQRSNYFADSNYSHWISLIESGLLILLLTHIMLKNYFFNKNPYLASSAIILFSVFTLLSLIVNFHQWQIERMLQVLEFVLAINAVTITNLESINTDFILRVYRFLFFSSILYCVLFPAYSASHCRSDKCSVLGNLTNSFFINEQSYAIFLLVTISLELGQKRDKQKFFILSSFITLVTTGSRTAIVAIFVILTLYFFRMKLRRHLTSTMSRVTIVTSALILFVASGSEFTGRAEIYGLIRENWKQLALFGKGMYFIQSGYTNTQSLSFLPSHEHGIVPMLYARFGFLVLAAFTLMLCSRKKCEPSLESFDFAILAVMIYGITESSLYPTYQNPCIWLILIQILKRPERVRLSL